MALWIPDAFQLDEGTEMSKLSATTHKADFSWLQQERLRTIDRQAAKGFDSPLRQLFDMAYTGDSTISAGWSPADPVQVYHFICRPLLLTPVLAYRAQRVPPSLI